MFKNLKEAMQYFKDEATCRAYLVKQRWNGVPTCPACGCTKSYNIENGKRFKCANNQCYKKYSVTVGTVFEASNIPLTSWFPAMFLISAHKKGISSCQLARDLGVTQKTAWFMLHRIRESLREKQSPLLTGIVEADETFVGGKYANMHKAKRAKLLAENNGSGFGNKTTVLGMIERGGKMVAKVMPPNTAQEIPSSIAQTVQRDSTLITDSANIYNNISHYYNYHAVNHSIQEYVRDNAHTNSIEGAFSHFKRMIYGIYHQITAKHTQRYCDEFTYRFNSRKTKDADRFTMALSAIEGRLTYKKLVASPLPKNIVYTVNPNNRGYGIIQLKGDEVIGQYRTFTEASTKTGVERATISLCCRGKRKSAGGFRWIFA